MKRHLITTLLLAGLCAGAASHAADLTGRLARIRDNATIVIAYNESAVPFSYIDAAGPKGYGVDLSLRIAQEIKKELGLEKLNIRWNPVTLSTRFPLMATDTVDLSCSTTTHTRAREKLANFSTTFHIARQGIASRADSGIQDFSDLVGKRIAVVRDTTTEADLRAKGLGDKLVLERNNRRAMGALADGRADAYVAAAELASAELVLRENSQAFKVVTTNRGLEAYACLLPQGDAAFKQVVDRSIASLMRSGDMEQLYRRWFEQPIPPSGRVINMALSAEDRALFAAPNDTPLE